MVAGPAEARENRTFVVLAIAVAVAIAVVDTALGADAMLTGALVAAPLVASVRADPRSTSLVLGLALALGLLGGALDDQLGAADHLTRLLTIVLGGGLAVYVAGLRTQREQDALRLRTQYAVARTLSEARSLADAVPQLLQAIGQPHGWDVGAYWEARRPDALRFVDSWRAPGVHPAGFDTASHGFVMRRGVGLPGRVWESAAPVWIPDLRSEDLPRAELADQADLRGFVGFPIKTPGGTVGVMEFSARRVREPEPELLEFFAALGSQIGEYVEGLRAEEALRASEAHKSAVVDSALDCVITMDHHGRVTGYNPAAERTFGYGEEEALGGEMAELIIPESLRQAHRTALLRYLETEEPTILGQRLELTGLRKDGSEFPVELAVSRIAGSSPPAFTGYLRDISERRRAQEEREQARDQLEAILSGVADGVTAQGPDGALLFANDAAVQVLGFETAEELLEAPLTAVMERFELFGEDGKTFPIERLPGRRALLGETGAEELVRFRVRATGDEHWSVVKSTPLFDDNGNVVMAINVFEDITEHKLAERQQSFLAESTGVLASSLDPDQTLRQVARLAVPEIADWCAVDLAADGGLQRVALVHSDPEQVGKAEEFQRRYPPDPHAPTGVPKVLRTGEPELWPDIPDELLVEAAEDAEHLALLRELGLRSAMVVPMIARGEAIGALTFAKGPSGRLFSKDDLPMAQELARRCAMAIDNSRVYGERDYIARTLQTSLLPAELPQIPGLETAARFRATGEGTEVGGDFYDLFHTGGRGWSVVVGDVCGKGPDAAAVTALARYTLRAAAITERLPSRVLALLNEALLRQPGERRFCTVAYAYLEALEDGARMGFASGGHPLPLVLRGDGSVEWLGSHGMLLGAVPDPSLEDCSAALAPGDAVVFYTDGVTEAGSPRGALGEERLAELVADCSGMDAEAIAGQVEAAALTAQDGAPRDDIAVVVVRVAPAGHQNGSPGP